MKRPHRATPVRRWLTLLGCLLPVSAMSTSVFLSASVKPALAQSQIVAETNRKNQLIGQWRLRDYLPIPLTVVFAEEGKLFVLLPSYFSFFMSAFGGNRGNTPEASVFAYEFRYQVNAATQPMQIDISAPSDDRPLMTIFEFTPDGQLRVEWEGLKPEDPRPTEFTVGSVFLQKVSNTTTLPRNTQLLDLAAERKASEQRSREAEGKQYISSLNRGQQAFYLESQKFATTIDDLSLGLESETENYRYQIIPQNNKERSIMMTAQAKKANLKSYTGAVFVIDVDGETTTLAGICETAEPSMTPPTMLIPPRNPQEGTVQCPTGSILVDY